MSLLCGNVDNTTYGKRDCTVDKLHFNKVNAIAILKSTTIPKDLSLPATWDGYVGATPTSVADDMIVVPDLKGTYNGGEFETEEGFGDVLESVVAGTHEMALTGVYLKKNADFYNDLLRKRNYGIAWISGGQEGDLHVVQRKMITTIPKVEIIEDSKMYRKFTLTCKWSDIQVYKSIEVSDEVKQLFF